MYSCDVEPVIRHYTIPYSHRGIEATVEHMQSIASRAACAPEVVDAAREIVGSSDGRTAAERIRKYLEVNVGFMFDPPGVELIRTPELLLTQIQCRGKAAGDCDDVAVFGAALGMAAGLPATYVLIGFHDTDPFEHVYTELETPDGLVELDTTRPAHLPPGLQIRRLERRRIAMYHNPCGDGLGGFWGDLWGGVKEGAGTVITERVETWGDDSDPYGTGYGGDGAQPAPIIVEAGPAPMSPILNTLLFGGLALAGLRLARII